ncbi:MAG TPA: M90 family metallopeptidase [Gemmatimonadaceae bacterium]|nr:M90 family metallopeptidase [Gemmatimonadaceae bacterium]
MTGYLARRRRDKLRAAPLPSEWRRILFSNVPLYERLSDADKRELEGHIQVMLSEKHWEGCGGLELTDEIRLTIAAQACVLLLHRDADYYPGVKSILVYPSTYVTEGERHIGGGIWEEGEEELLGHTQHRLGAVVLAWDASLHGSRIYGDGVNVVLHEFAHQLDFENDGTDGTPALQSNHAYISWARVLGKEFEQLREAHAVGRPAFLDRYGATNPAEFFAVATEFFFERPAEMEARHPDLYAELKAFYQQDPAESVKRQL